MIVLMALEVGVNSFWFVHLFSNIFLTCEAHQCTFCRLYLTI